MKRQHKPCVNVNEAARQLSATGDHVRRLIKAGRLNATNISLGSVKRYRIDQGEIDRFKRESK